MIVFLLRHADRADNDDLVPAGFARAELLGRMLAESGVAVAFRSDFARAEKTLAPLKARLGGALDVRTIPFTDPTKPGPYATKVAAAVRALPPDTSVAVVGHTNTVDLTIERLGGGAIDEIEHHEFDKLFVLFLAPPAPATLLRLRYGEATKGPAMRRSPIAILASFILLAPLFGCAAAHAQQRDVAGSRDYPGIGRFDGSVITGYQVKDFDAARLQAAAFRDGQPVDARRLEGRITRIAYRTEPGPSILEVSRNFETQLAKAGFETLLACDADACGGIPFVEGVDALPIPQMWVDGFDYRYYAGRKAEGGRETYAAVLVSKNNDNVYCAAHVAVVGAIENKMVDAAAMAKGLGEKGHIALYGIYFDTDKAVIKPESRPTLDEIAKLLRGQPQLNVVIVGHTDSQGAYDYNMDLSRRRAEAIAAELVRPTGSPRTRLRTAGVGFLAPVGSNATRRRPRAQPAGGAGGAVALHLSPMRRGSAQCEPPVCAPW